MFKQVDPIKALAAGILGTVVMTVVMYALPLIGIPPMDIMAALGSVFPAKISPYIPGFLVHFAIGIALAFVYAAFFYSWLPRPNWLRGALFSLAPWLFAITLLGPTLGLASKLFSGASTPATANPCAPKGPVNPCAAANPCAVPANPCVAKPVNPCAPPVANPCAAGAANPCAPGAAAKGGIPPQALSLVAHLIYGVVLGGLYRPRA